MISKGYFRVTKEDLKKILKTHGLDYAKKFIQEMFNYGGRVSFNEYEYWLNFLKKERRCQNVKNYELLGFMWTVSKE